MLIFLLDPLVVVGGELLQLLHVVDVGLLVILVILQLERLRPVNLIQVEEHPLLDLRLTVVNGDRVVVLVETSGESHQGWLRDMTNVAGGLTRLLAHHHCLWVDGPEGVDHNFTFDRLDGVNDYSDSARVQLFLGFLGLNIGAGEPAAETWMGVIPPSVLSPSIQFTKLTSWK